MQSLSMAFLSKVNYILPKQYEASLLVIMIPPILHAKRLSRDTNIPDTVRKCLLFSFHSGGGSASCCELH